MCGIVGALSPKYFDHSFINQMTGSILHRGPDRRGTFFDEKREIKRLEVDDHNEKVCSSRYS